MFLLGPKSTHFEISNFTDLLFWGQKEGWQPDKVYFIHSETCHNYIINFHEHKTYLSKGLSTEKEKTTVFP